MRQANLLALQKHWQKSSNIKSDYADYTQKQTDREGEQNMSTWKWHLIGYAV